MHIHAVWPSSILLVDQYQVLILISIKNDKSEGGLVHLRNSVSYKLQYPDSYYKLLRSLCILNKIYNIFVPYIFWTLYECIKFTTAMKRQLLLLTDNSVKHRVVSLQEENWFNNSYQFKILLKLSQLQRLLQFGVMLLPIFIKLFLCFFQLHNQPKT